MASLLWYSNASSLTIPSHSFSNMFFPCKILKNINNSYIYIVYTSELQRHSHYQEYQSSSIFELLHLGSFWSPFHTVPELDLRLQCHETSAQEPQPVTSWILPDGYRCHRHDRPDCIEGKVPAKVYINIHVPVYVYLHVYCVKKCLITVF